jgi:large subunit ribosomal protein L16
MTRYIKRGGQIWIRIFPHTPVTRKPQDVKMGSGKGNPEFFVAKVKQAQLCLKWTALPNLLPAKLCA